LILLDSSTLTEFVARLFVACGVPREDAHQVAMSLVGADLRGHESHGTMRIHQYIEALRTGRYRARAELTVIREAGPVMVAEGHLGLGAVLTHRFLDQLIPKAREFGVAVGAARRFGHAGRIGEYAERAVAEGLAFIAFGNNDGAGQRVIPPGGIEPRLGTNPLCLASPTTRGPLVLDLGTSAVSEGKVRIHHLDGNRPIPEGWVIDHRGRPTTNPAVLYEKPTGSILPMGGLQSYKGFGLALLLDLLSAGLTGGHCVNPDPPPVIGNNLVFILMDPVAFAGTEHLLDQSAILETYIRGCPVAMGQGPIRLPGDRERALLHRRQREGLPMSEPLWTRLTRLGEELGVPVPHGLVRRAN